MLDALKEEQPDKFLALSWTSKDLIATVKVKTQNEDMKTAFLSRLERKDPDNTAMQNEAKKQFEKLKQSDVNWKSAEFVDFNFERQGISNDVNFEWGSALLSFESEEQHFKVKIGEFIQLVNGWKGSAYTLE